MPTNTQEDRIFDGTNGDDVLSDQKGGGGWNSTLNGKGGDDILNGRGGDDLLKGGTGNDVLDGGSGEDRLIGGRGNDVLKGSSGADRFEVDARDLRMSDAANIDIIRDLDFDRGDVLKLNLFRGLFNDADGDGRGGDIFGSNNAFQPVETVDGAEDLIALINLMTAHDNMEVRVVNANGKSKDYVVLDFAKEGPNQHTIIIKGDAGRDAANTLMDAGVVDDQAARTNNTVRRAEDVFAGLTAEEPLELGAPVTGLVTDDDGAVVDFDKGQVAAVVDHVAAADTTGDDAGDGDDADADDDTTDVLTGTDAQDILVGGDAGDTLEGLAGNDLLVGRDGADVMMGGADDDLLVGELGDDTMDGGAGNDALHGHDGDDVIIGGDGDDLLTGEAGEDVLSGGDGADRLHGHEGDDTLDGGAGNDFLTGEGGDDRIAGGDGDDEVYGHSGNDTITGGAGDDLLFGDDGDDTIHAGPGTDTVYVGGGKDVVRFETGDGDLTVKDFNAWEGDVLDLTGTDLGSFEELQAAATQTEDWGGHLQIDLGGGDSVTLEWVTLDHISPDAFLI